MLLSHLIIRIFIINIYKDVKLKKDKNEIRTISRKKQNNDDKNIFI